MLYWTLMELHELLPPCQYKNFVLHYILLKWCRNIRLFYATFVLTIQKKFLYQMTPPLSPLPPTQYTICSYTLLLKGLRASLVRLGRQGVVTLKMSLSREIVTLNIMWRLQNVLETKKCLLNTVICEGAKMGLCSKLTLHLNWLIQVRT